MTASRRTYDDYWDYAWLELADPVSGMEALDWAEAAPDARIVSVHHSAALPAKVTTSTVTRSDDGTFVSTVDAFGGASGGPVFSPSGEFQGEQPVN
ncbi:MAG TPA: trypsin-like peptidase domain-containing protein [Polyangiaceae bacterium]